MEFKGTKEKWEVFTDSYTNEITIYPSDSTVAICDMANTYKKDKYNALLISKAPEMLEFLQSLVSSEMTPLAIRKQAKQLIKEATEL